MKTQNPIIEKLIQHIEAECKIVDLEAIFDEMLDECYSFDSVGGPFASICPSNVLKEVDPTAYRCGVNDYFGTDNSYTEVAGETYRNDDLDKAKEEFIEGLESEIDTLESEIDDLKAEEDPSLSEVASKERQFEELKSDLEAANHYTF